MRKYLCAEGIFFARYITQLLQHGKVGIGLDITGETGVTIPVPGAAKIGGRIDDADIVYTCLPQPRAGQQATETAPDDQNLHLVSQRLSLKPRIGIGVIQKMCKALLDCNVLLIALHTQPFIAFTTVLVAQRIGIKLYCILVGCCHLFIHPFKYTEFQEPKSTTWNRLK